MANREKDIAEAILKPAGLSLAGLRFDRVVGRVLGDLRAFTDQTAPPGVAVMVTITAPIRVPAKTAEILRLRIAALLASGDQGDRADVIHENRVSLRGVRRTADGRPSLVGFVHNRDVEPGPLLDLAARWLAPSGYFAGPRL